MTEATPRILLADDDANIRAILREHLETYPCELFEAADGEAALEMVLVERPHLVVLDVMMPLMSGWELCRYISTHSGTDVCSGTIGSFCPAPPQALADEGHRWGSQLDECIFQSDSA